MNKTLVLPNPVLITIRAACAHVANLSGAAEQAGTQCSLYHASHSVSNPLLLLPPRLLSKPIEFSEIWKILQCWQMMGVWLNFFLHACQRQHPDLLSFEGNISHVYWYALVIFFCKCHRIASVMMTLVRYIYLLVLLSWALIFTYGHYISSFFVRSFLTPTNRHATNLIGQTTAKTKKRYTSFKGSRGHLWTQTLLRHEESHLGPWESIIINMGSNQQEQRNTYLNFQDVQSVNLFNDKLCYTVTLFHYNCNQQSVYIGL